MPAGNGRPPSTAPRTAEPPATEPGGLRRVSGPGYTIAVPVGWSRSVEGKSVFWRDPGSAGYIQVDRTGWSGDPSAHWRQWESEVKAKNVLPRFSRVDLRVPSGVPYSAADLEFTWFGREGVSMHGIDRGVQAGGRPFAVFVAIPADQWDESQERVNNVLGSFRP